MQYPPFIHCFRQFVENEFPHPPSRINFGRNSNPMETLSHIIASFDIFQVILNAFPQIFNPIVQAFQGIFLQLFHFMKPMVVTHPGIISGMMIFFIGYGAVKAIGQFRKVPISSPQPSQPQSL